MREHMGYYWRDPTGISIRERLMEKHTSLWPGRMPALGELRGQEEVDTRAWLRDFHALEVLVMRDGPSLEFAEGFEGLKERRRQLIRTYAPWWRDGADAMTRGNAAWQSEADDCEVQTVISLETTSGSSPSAP